MDSKMASMLLMFLAVLGWVLIVVVLAEKKSVTTIEVRSNWKSSYTVGCGVFKCSGGGNPADSSCVIGDRAAAAQAFGVMSVLLLSFTMVVHFIQAIGQGAIIPGAITPYVKFVHIVAAVFLLVFWVVMVIWVTTDDGYCQGGDTSYGIFFAVAVMLMEIGNYFLCAMGGNGDAGPQSLI
eukprot:TRINITY_DN45148_c0_g1_i1.p1 TRINITY_DN45148_c0_g1~~TRINITY_DN45148_c0_g1_i1.p1  ORF type:complete len:180 (+),score=70.42 TRINITY_DN45148_c0_g1_i1:68-607(+)